MTAFTTTKAIDTELTTLQRRRAALEGDRHRIDGQVREAEGALARAVKRGAPGGGIAEAQADLRGLRDDLAGVVAALALIGREVEALAAERHPLTVQEARQVLDDTEDAAIAAMDRAHAALDDALRRAVAPALALHTEAVSVWYQVDAALADLRRVSPGDVSATLRRDQCQGRWPSLTLADALRTYLTRDERYQPALDDRGLAGPR